MSLYTELKSKNDILRKEEIPHYKIVTIKSFTCEIQNLRLAEEIEWIISQVEKGKFCITNFSIFKKWIDKHEDRLIKKKRIKANAETLYRSVAYQHKFNEYQLDEIYKGYKNGVDAMVYAKAEYNYEQMQQIRYGLEIGLDVTKYSNPQFNSMQMRIIRLGMEEDIDVSWYADIKYDFNQMEQIKLGLKKGVNVGVYAKEEYPYTLMSRLRLELEEKLERYMKDNH